MSAASASRARRAVRIMDLMKSFEIFRASIPSAVLGLGSMVAVIASCGVVDKRTQNDALGSTDAAILVDAADGMDGNGGNDDGKDGTQDKADGTVKDGAQDKADGTIKDGTQDKADGTVKDGTQDKADGTIKDAVGHDAAYSDTATEAKGSADSSSKSDRGSTSIDGLAVDGSLRGCLKS